MSASGPHGVRAWLRRLSSGGKISWLNVAVLLLCSTGALLAASAHAPNASEIRGAEEPVLGREQPIEDPSGRGLATFHAALGRALLGQGQARVIWWGASHTASDGYVGFLREQLQRRFGDAGPGFVSLVRPFRGWDHTGAEVSSGGAWRTLRGDRGPLGLRYGFAGFASEARAAGAWGGVDLAEAETGPRQVSQYELYFLRQPGGGRFDVFIDGTIRATLSTDAAQASAGYALFRVRSGSARLLIRTRDEGPVRVFGVALERDRPGVLIDTLGIPGSRARGHLRWHEGLLREQLRRRRPDLVVLAYGTNESEDVNVPRERYQSELRRVVQRLRSMVPDASCLLVGPSDRPLEQEDGTFEPRRLTDEIIAIQRLIASEQGCGFFDLAAFMGGPLSMLRWVEHDYAQSDHIHFTRRGQRRLAEVLGRALLRGAYPVPTRRAPEAI